MQDKLQKIVDETPGAVGALLMGFDGIVVDQYAAPGQGDLDIESIAMEFSFRFIELREAAKTLELGRVDDITVKAEHGTILARVLSDEFFLALLLVTPGQLGKGRWMLRSQAAGIVGEL